jgi:hypothetical protein
MTESENGGLPEAAATPVSSDIPRYERIARLIESDDASDLSGFATYAPHPVEGDTTCGGWGDENVDFADDDTSDSDTCARPAGAAPEGELDGCRTAGETPTASPPLGASMSRKSTGAMR